MSPLGRLILASLAATALTSCVGGGSLFQSCRFSYDSNLERTLITRAVEAAGISPASFDMAKPFVQHDEDGYLTLTFTWRDMNANVLDPPNLEVTFNPCTKRVLKVQTFPSYLITRRPVLELPGLGHL